ncbi:MAG: hypothetical protein HUU32_21845 [Calditrichaceae bacterium]|nr:hypothetical protein [Calditrichia bacterium]NUQ44040.1 hypothetical protein [Calditrichaceae bacterium]
MQRPDFITDEHLGVLAAQEETLLGNLFSAVPLLLKCFPELTAPQAQEVLRYWWCSMKTLAQDTVLAS